VGVEHHDGVAGLRGDLRDSRAHRAGSAHTHDNVRIQHACSPWQIKRAIETSILGDLWQMTQRPGSSAPV
jgi:hypothetical protein